MNISKGSKMEKLTTTAKILIVVAIIANSVGMFFPVLSSTFSPYYGSIAKHIVLTNNWTDLVLSGHDWLDKPHFPFWMTALSFKLFGINSFAYILPGFLFNLLGVFYTYRLARLWYGKEVGVISALFTVTALHLMMSGIDVRAEAYLVGEIMPACYYWLKYDRQAKFKYLLLGALFTGMALMTKGVFILVTIISGVAFLWIYRRKWSNFVSPKWLGALALSFVFIAPEIIALYQQFDAQPAKVVFEHTHVSGIRWYFWDSQFGRFFNTGPIMSTNPPAYHYVFFVHTFLWAYLPWWPMFFAALWSMFKKRKDQLQEHREASVFLLASFFVTFAMFSATKFQVDHYTNIIFPFASIICANWLVNLIRQHKTTPAIYWIELGISMILLAAVFALGPIALKGANLTPVIGCAVLALLAVFVLWKKSWSVKTLVYPTVAMCTVFVFAMFVNGDGYAKYDAGYQMARYLNQQPQTIPVLGYRIDLLSLDFHVHNPYTLTENLETVTSLQKPVYLVTKTDQLPEVETKFPGSQVMQNFAGGSIETYLQNVTNPDKLTKELTKYVVVQIN